MLSQRLCGAMSWRSVRSAAGAGVPLDAWLGLTWGPRWTSAASGQCSCWPSAACCMPGWAVVCPVHEASWPGSQASCLLPWCSFAELPSWCVTGKLLLPNELLFAGQLASFIQITAGQPALPLAGWQSWWVLLPESSFACQGPFPLFVEVDRGGSERVVCCGV